MRRNKAADTHAKEIGKNDKLGTRTYIRRSYCEQILSWDYSKPPHMDHHGPHSFFFTQTYTRTWHFSSEVYGHIIAWRLFFPNLGIFMHVGNTNLLWLQIEEMMHEGMLCIHFGGENFLCTNNGIFIDWLIFLVHYFMDHHCSSLLLLSWLLLHSNIHQNRVLKSFYANSSMHAYCRRSMWLAHVVSIAKLDQLNHILK